VAPLTATAVPALRYLAISLPALSAFLSLYAPQAILPLLADEFDATPGQVGATMTTCTIAVAIIAPFSGALADVLGRKRVIAAAMLLLALPTAMVALTPDLTQLLAWRFAQGLLIGPIMAVTIAYIGREWPPAEATAVTGIYTAAVGIGGFLGRFLTGVLAEWVGWRGAFLVNAALSLLCAVGAMVLLAPERRSTRASSMTAALGQMLKHLRNPRLLAVYTIGFGVLFNMIAIFTYINFHLAAAPYALSPSLLGSIFVVYLLGTLVLPLTGRAVAFFGRRRFVICVLATWIVGMGMTLAPPLPLIILGLALSVVCGFYTQATSTSYVVILAREGPSAASGLYFTSFYVGGSVGAALGGLAWTIGRLPAVIAITALMAAAMIAIVRLAWSP
jgi:MFS transporter, YNFM family, putative membrane transport protein